MDEVWSDPMPVSITGEDAAHLWKRLIEEDCMVYYDLTVVYYRNKALQLDKTMEIPLDLTDEMVHVRYMNERVVKVRASLLDLLMHLGDDIPRNLWDYLLDNKHKVCYGDISADDAKVMVAISR